MRSYFSLVKFSHTIFALPFALLGFFIATEEDGGNLKWEILLLVLLCMVFARNAAMAFNRFLDRDIDEKNPRTAEREIPSGIISPRAALIFVVVNSVAFMVTSFFINKLCFLLSPIALSIILSYSFTKRFTWLCHFVLGLGLSLAPIGAYLAVTAKFDALPVLYGLTVLTWVAGFDIIYALQDEDFDKSMQLHSIPVFLGIRKALHLSGFLHVLCGLTIVLAGWEMSKQFPDLGWMHWLGAGSFICLLIYQHGIVKSSDLSRINLAFFTTNGFASIIFGILVILDFLT